MRRKIFGVDTNRKGPQPAGAVPPIEGQAVSRHMQFVAEQVGEVVAITVALETDEVVSQHRLGELAVFA